MAGEKVDLGINQMVIDEQSSTTAEPYGIITIDCSEPKEIDDGIAVERLDDEGEKYRVRVCVADTSGLYGKPGFLNTAMQRVEARYFSLPNDEKGYDPMLPLHKIRDLEFTEGNERSALMVSFTVGEDLPPSDVDVSFGTVLVKQNMSYRDFILARRRVAHQQALRASSYIISGLKYNPGGDADSLALAQAATPADVQDVFASRRYSTWLRGSKVNESFMVAANHLVGKLLAEEGRPAIYRVHDPEDERHISFLPPNVATYDLVPARHFGLGLSHYCRVTSPLRRLEDFMMGHQLRQRALGRTPGIRDEVELRTAMQRLNRHVASQVQEGPVRFDRQSVLGVAGTRNGKRAVVESIA